MPTEETPTPPAPPAPEATQPAQQTAPQPTPPQPTAPKLPSDERLLAAASYIPMLFVGAVIMKPKSPFCQIHGKQGMVLTVVSFVTLMILAIVPLIGSLLFLALIALIAIAASKAYGGEQWKIPVLGDIANKINVDQIFAGTTVKPTSAPSEPPQPPDNTPPTKSQSNDKPKS